MNDLVNSQEMKQYDKNTIEQFGIPSVVLMERAALAVFAEIKKRFSFPCGKILLLCGAGNNGGDGFAVARLLHLAGYDVEIFFPMKEAQMTAETKAQYHTAKKYQIPESSDLSDASYAVIIDALFGIGLSRNIEGELYKFIDYLNKKDAFRIAVDISSGISADTGQVLGIAFCADLTVTFGFAKIGQLLYPGADYTGELIVSDIGIDANSFLEQKPRGSYLKKESLKELLPKRKAYSNKGSYGKVFLIAGSPDMAGAAYFAAKAAYYSGCGLVRIFTPKENRKILLTKLPEAIITAYDSKETMLSQLEEGIRWADAVLIGPGLSKSETAQLLLEKTILLTSLEEGAKKIVFDADALNLLSKNKSILKETNAERIITPHLGEMSRLLEEPIERIKENLVQTATAFAKEYQLTCILKDARTVIGMPDGTFFVNTTGNHGMATAGSGDVLAGFLAGFLAQGLDLKRAAILSVCLHGTAGDFAAEKKGTYGMIASDLLEMLPMAIKSIMKENENA